MPGKHGNAIHLPNAQTYDDNIISLGNHDNDCLGNVILCPKGVTFSIWFKAPAQVHDWPWLLLSSEIRVYMRRLADGRLEPNYAMHAKEYGSKDLFTLNEWHLLVLTYHDLQFKAYQDGCEVPVTFQYDLQIRQFDFDIGCKLTGNCMIVTVDDFRFWGEEKDSRFVWWLWSQ